MDEQLHFAPFRLDLASERLWRGGEPLPLRPKIFALLRYLVEHADRLIPQSEVIAAVWGHPHLSEALLRGCIRELRRALGDDAHTPRFIETATRRGWRFVAPVSRTATPSTAAPTVCAAAPPTLFVGREDELAWLHARLQWALHGRRQFVFVSGEPGIGKTAIVEAFLTHAASQHPIAIGRGQCVEQHGRGEPYLPVLEALDRLAREGGQGRVAAVLRRHAPSWLLHLPALCEPGERAQLLALASVDGEQRIVRELAEALDVLAAQQLVVLWLEDLHWSDPSTVQLLGLLARRIESARLFVVGTWRPAEAIDRGHPLRALAQELRSHGLCAELALRALNTAEVARYLALRCACGAEGDLLDATAQRLHRRIDGMPLFMVALVDDLVARCACGDARLAAIDAGLDAELPRSLHPMLERQVECLDAEQQQVLGAGCIAGIVFSTAMVAAVASLEPARVEACCERLVQARLFLDRTAPHAGPERRAAERYRFRHALYREVLRRRMPAAAQRRLHRRIGAWKERHCGERAAAIAAELAEHFEQGGDPDRALRYRQQAAQQALQRATNREAVEHLERALRMLALMPDGAERD